MINLTSFGIVADPGFNGVRQMRVDRMLKIIVCAFFLVFSVLTFAANDVKQQMQQIKANYAQVNSSLASYKKVSKALEGLTAEGGSVVGYYHNGQIVKMKATFLGETGRAIEEYYFKNGNLVFVYYEKLYYPRPGLRLASRSKDRFYFHNNKLIKWLQGRKQVSQKHYASQQTGLLRFSGLLQRALKHPAKCVEFKHGKLVACKPGNSAKPSSSSYQGQLDNFEMFPRL